MRTRGAHVARDVWRLAFPAVAVVGSTTAAVWGCADVIATCDLLALGASGKYPSPHEGVAARLRIPPLRYQIEAISPRFIVAMATSHACTTSPAPRWNEKGVPRSMLESNLTPFDIRKPS